MGVTATKTPPPSEPPRPPSITDLRIVTERLAAWRKGDMTRAHQTIRTAAQRMRRIRNPKGT